MLLKLFTVKPQHRMLVIKNGRPWRVLTPGRHLLFIPPFSTVQTETHSLRHVLFRSRWADDLARDRKDLLAEHFTQVQTSASQLALVSVDGDLSHVLLPARRQLFWKASAQINVQYTEVIEDADVFDSVLPFFDSGRGAIHDALDTVDDSGSGPLLEQLLDREMSSHSGRVDT